MAYHQNQMSSISNYDPLPLRDLHPSSLTYTYPSASTIPRPNASQSIRDEAMKYLKLLDQELLYRTKNENESFSNTENSLYMMHSDSQKQVEGENHKAKSDSDGPCKQNRFGNKATIDRRLIMNRLQMITNNILFEDNVLSNY